MFAGEGVYLLPVTKNCFAHLEHERKERKEERAKNVEFLNALLDVNVKED